MARWTAALAIILVLAATLAQPARAEGSAYLSGSVFLDANGNGVAEPGEAGIPAATVYLRSLADPSLVLTTSSDAQGYYLLSGVPYGHYETWADADGTGPVRIVAFDEVKGTATTDLPIIDNSGDVEMVAVRMLYLPALGR